MSEQVQARERDGHDHPHDNHDDHDHPHNNHDDHDHPHGDHDHPHGDHDDHDHGPGGHSHGSGVLGWLGGIFHVHGHSEERLQRAADPAYATEEGIRTIWLALAALGITTVIQIVIVALSGSVALLADTAHNLVDALNSVPLLIAFYLARRVADRRYTYGFGKAEDVAGIFIVLSIVVSAGYIFWESFGKLLNPTLISNGWWVAGAAVVGFIGNEIVASLQIRKGREIGSDAMVADGLHARTDGLTSLAVLPAVAGSALGYPIVDPIVGLLIGATILFIARDAAKTMWYRLMDAVEPTLVDAVEQAAARVAGVEQAHQVRVRWIGHQLHAELHVVVDEDLPTHASHRIAEEVRHALFHAQPRLADIVVHVDPCGHGGDDHHAPTAHHARA
jgi:cation diffusion facilitator family transporter